MQGASYNNHDLCTKFENEGSGLNIKALGLISPMLYTMRRDVLEFISHMVLSPNERHMPASPYLLNPVSALAETELPPCWLVTSAHDFLRSDSHGPKAELDRLQVEHSFMEWPLSAPKMLGHIFCVLYPRRSEGVETIDGMTIFFQAHTNQARG